MRFARQCAIEMREVARWHPCRTRFGREVASSRYTFCLQQSTSLENAGPSRPLRQPASADASAPRNTLFLVERGASSSQIRFAAGRPSHVVVPVSCQRWPTPFLSLRSACPNVHASIRRTLHTRSAECGEWTHSARGLKPSPAGSAALAPQPTPFAARASWNHGPSIVVKV